MSIINNTAPYSQSESLFYDIFVASAVSEMLSGFQKELANKILNKSRVLDVGSGGGHIAVQLAQSRKDCKITALDLSLLLNKRAMQRSKKANEAIEFVQGSALELPFEENCFDTVYSVGSIRHWPQPALGLKECMRVLKPKGLLFIIGVNKQCTEVDARNYTKKWRYPGFLKPVAYHIFKKIVVARSFTIEDAEAIASQANLEDAEIVNIPGTVVWILRRAKEDRGDQTYTFDKDNT